MTQQALQTLSLDSLTIDPRLQTRVGGINERVAQEYADSIQQGEILPPVTVFDDGECLMLAAGFHRVHARRLLGLSDVEAFVRRGSFKEALLFGLQDNARHGLRRTDEDKRHAVELVLLDPEWRQWSTNAIAQRLNLSWGFVDRVRGELCAGISEVVKYERQNEVRTMAVGRRGRRAGNDSNLEVPEVKRPDVDARSVSDNRDGESRAEDASTLPVRQIRRDAAGYLIPKGLAKVFGDALHFDAPGQIDRLMTEFIAVSRWSKFLRLSELLDALACARRCIIDAQPHVVHQPCRGRGCEQCRDSGYLSRLSAEEANGH